jgi:voltage-gated potassium channel
VPVSVYWAISTMTTVGYGDITPKTGFGRFIASLMMLIGWGTLAVPTGIVSAEFTAIRFANTALGRDRVCSDCGSGSHTPTARFCQDCGAALPPR